MSATPFDAPPRRLAAADLGSNSFRLLIGRVEQTPLGDQIRTLDNLKEPVRLAAGLDADGLLDDDACRRALAALQRFGERLRSFHPDAVRAVATNTLRVARNARRFLASAEAALGFPIDVIAGREEARLIYLGAAHALPPDDADRLVVDIGGGSTECVIGQGYAPKLLESSTVGCVSLSRAWFPDGEVSATAFEHAYYAARDALASTAHAYRQHGWHYAVGTSGTAKALTQIAADALGSPELTRDALGRMASRLIDAGHADRLELAGLKADRRPVFAGGLALMTAIFDELGVASMRYCGAALRQGVLYDLLGRSAGADMREVTVARMTRRYGVDETHAQCVAQTALALFDQAARGTPESVAAHRELLRWASMLAEVGMTLSHEDFHRHSAYMLRHGDMPGFTQSEQALMADLAFGHVGGLRKLRDAAFGPMQWLMVLCLRIASILHRRRDGDRPPVPVLHIERSGVRLEVPAAWAGSHPLSDQTLEAEAQAWSALRVFDPFEYRRR